MLRRLRQTVVVTRGMLADERADQLLFSDRGATKTLADSRSSLQFPPKIREQCSRLEKMPPRKNKSKKKHHKQNNNNNNANHNTNNNNASRKEDTSGASPPLPYKVESSSIVGRYLVASRDLSPGELIITENPLAIGPCVSADAVCLGCYMPVSLNYTQYRCPKCRWPMCGPKCVGLGQPYGHSALECALLESLKSVAADLLTAPCSPVAAKNLYELILIVRLLLLRDHDAEKYATLLLMESHLEMRKQNDVLWQHYQRNVVDRLRNEWQLRQFTETEIHTVCGIVDVNCFEIGQNTAKARTLYPSAFLLAHDCSPNTSHTDDPLTYAIILRTSRPICKDEAITLSYAYTLQGTLKRRDFMHAGKLFWCSCQRCADPTELGTDCSGIVCTKCTKGTLRATDPLDQEAEWKCDLCAKEMSAKDVVDLIDNINNDMERIDVHDVSGLESFLLRYRDVLRPNHYLLLSAKYSLCQIYGRIEGYLLHHMSLDDIRRKERYCREFLAVIDVLEPGLTRLRGLISYELHAPIMIISQYLVQSNAISRQDFQRNIKEVTQLLRESRNILLMEPKGSSEHQMGLAAAEALLKMGCA